MDITISRTNAGLIIAAAAVVGGIVTVAGWASLVAIGHWRDDKKAAEIAAAIAA